jgi:hypothetical protein
MKANNKWQAQIIFLYAYPYWKINARTPARHLATMAYFEFGQSQCDNDMLFPTSLQLFVYKSYFNAHGKNR